MPHDSIILGRHGAVKRELARQLRRSMTPAETLLWKALRRSQLAGLHFRRQQIIDGFIVDFYCHAARLVIELDGPIHDGRKDYDAERDRILSVRSLAILRIPNDRVLGQLAMVLNEINSAALTRIAELAESTDTA
jgi:very-short-patch-repair endonuclease